MEAFYYAVVEKEPGSDFGVWFPDFPGCVAAGGTHTEALIAAREALQFHADGMIEDDMPLPEPTSWERLGHRDAITPDGGKLVTLVSVRLPSKSKRINITIDEGLLARIEARTNNVSGFLADAAREKLKAG